MSLLQDLFRAQAKAHPDLLAVSDGERSLTYKQLDELTDRLAAELQRRGACVDSSVVIYMSKSINYVVSYVSILKAGAAYLPMDGNRHQPDQSFSSPSLILLPFALFLFSCLPY